MTTRTVAASFALGASLLMASNVPLKSPALDGEELAALAKAAKTPAEHLTVAKHYQTRAERFEAEAKRHEDNANRLAKRDNHFPLAHKWPAMAQAPVDRERAKAMQARRAAKECVELAAKHNALSREAGQRADE